MTIYKSKAAATADRACLARLHTALNAANNAMRRAMRFGERPVHDPAIEAERISDGRASC